MELKLTTLFVGIAGLFLSPALVTQSDAIMSFSQEAAATQLEVEAKFDQLLSADNLDECMKYMSARPHHVMTTN